MTCGQSGVAMGNLWLLLAAGGVMAAVIGFLTLLNNRYTLNNIKSKTVGDGQHGTARWATDAEIRKAYALVPFQAASWRRGQRRPEVQGLVLGSISHKRGITALVDKDDVHCLMIGASGVGKTAYFLYPNLEYACASGMSFLALDTKGDLARNYGAIAEKYYGYHVSVVDLRNPTRSDGYNLMTLINHYMDAAQATGSLAARAKAEKYAKILAKTIVSPNGDATEGSVSVNDRRLGKDLDFPESVGVMIESPAFIDEYTGQKNLELLAGLKQLISASDIHNTLQAVGLDPNDKRTFKKYSLGMKQRLGIAAALMEKPDLLILDEPTNALDEQGVAMIAQLIRKECQCGALVVVACHDADFVQSVSDVVIQIQAGRVTSVIGK